MRPFHPSWTLLTAGVLLAAMPRTGEVRAEPKPAKEFALPDLNGRVRTLSEQRGKVVVLTFWATWCGPCRIELPRLHEVYKRHKREAFEVYAINVDNAWTVALVPAFAEQLRLSFPVLLDTDNKVAMGYDPRGVIPFTVVVDHEGRIRHMHSGYTPGDEVKLEREIVKLLQAAEAAHTKEQEEPGSGKKPAAG